jgi:ABC-2 type transport system permease protein
MRTFLDFVWHDTQMTMRNKQALFWSFFFPVMLMGLMGVVFGQQNAFTAKLAIVQQDQTAAGSAVVAAFKQVPAVKVSVVSDEQQALADLKNGDYAGVLVLPPGLAQGAKSGSLDLPYYYDNSSMIQASEVNSVVQQVLQQLSYFATNTKPPFTLKMQAVAAAGFNYIDFLVPGVIAMAIMTNGIYAVSGTFVTYRQKGVLHRLRATPMPLSSFIGASVLVHLVRSLIQAALVLAVGVFVFHVHVAGVHLLLRVAVLALVGAGCFVTIGFFVAAVAKNVEIAAALGQVIGTPMMFLSGIFFPMENAPAWIQPVVKLMPLTYLANGLRDVILHGTPLWFVRLDLAVLAVFTVVFMGLSVRYFRWE